MGQQKIRVYILQALGAEAALAQGHAQWLEEGQKDLKLASELQEQLDRAEKGAVQVLCTPAADVGVCHGVRRALCSHSQLVFGVWPAEAKAAWGEKARCRRLNASSWCLEHSRQGKPLEGDVQDTVDIGGVQMGILAAQSIGVLHHVGSRNLPVAVIGREGLLHA